MHTLGSFSMRQRPSRTGSRRPVSTPVRTKGSVYRALPSCLNSRSSHRFHALSRQRGDRRRVVHFPGGGKYFFWQSGVSAYLREAGLLDEAQLTGVSAVSATGFNVLFFDSVWCSVDVVV